MKTTPIINQETGICSNCIAHTFCLYESAAFSPIQQCESYELNRTILPKKLIHENYIHPITIQGLCGNCELVNQCTLRTSEAIILSCEEYK